MECRNQNCRKNLSIPSNALIIRCLECQTAYSVANNDDDDRSDEVLNYKGMKDWCQDLEIKKQEVKLHFKKLPLTCCNPQTKNSLPPPISAIAQPRGGRRALICGVSYKKKKHELKGTAQDVKNMHNMLRKEYGFPEESFLILSEEEGYHDPTRKNIEEGFDWLMRGIQAGDSLLFYFSGHGKRLREFENDEKDGFDETICPLDFETNGMIVDNEINKAIVRPLVKGVVLHAIIDSCHSGTVLDLPYVYDIKGLDFVFIKASIILAPSSIC